ncbi:MAG: ProQ family protein [Gammaproteobacteria bacterium]|nr:ProQ family protein [Gammaproteobacteria bacterium]
MNISRQKKHITLAELKNIMQAEQPSIKPKSSPAKKPVTAKMEEQVAPDSVKESNLAKQAEIQREASLRRQQRYQEAKSLLEFLCTNHPECFNLKFRKPLKVGIDKDILSKYPEKITKKTLLANALKIYTLNIRYWKGILTQEDRVDLEGKPHGKVTEEQKSHAAAPYQRALSALAERQRKMKKSPSRSKAPLSKA